TSTHQKNEFGGGGKGVQCGAAALARNTIKPISPATTPTTTQAAAAPPPGATRRSTTRCPSRARPLEGVHHNNSALTPTAAGNTTSSHAPHNLALPLARSVTGGSASQRRSTHTDSGRQQQDHRQGVHAQNPQHGPAQSANDDPRQDQQHRLDKVQRKCRRGPS